MHFFAAQMRVSHQLGNLFPFKIGSICSCTESPANIAGIRHQRQKQPGQTEYPLLGPIIPFFSSSLRHKYNGKNARDFTRIFHSSGLPFWAAFALAAGFPLPASGKAPATFGFPARCCLALPLFSCSARFRFSEASPGFVPSAPAGFPAPLWIYAAHPAKFMGNQSNDGCQAGHQYNSWKLR